MNPVAPGRIIPVSQGTTSANQMPLNPDGTLTVEGIGGGQYAHFVVVGWSAPAWARTLMRWPPRIIMAAASVGSVNQQSQVRSS